MFLFALLSACEIPPDTYEYGKRLSELRFEPYSPDVGVHPDQSILDDPNNPFRTGMDGDTRWQVSQDGVVASFYAWATMLAFIPTGEHQFYAAFSAHSIYEEQLASPEDDVLVRSIAIRGYQNVLDEFPDSRIFDATGRNSFAIAPLAYQGIEALGGEVQGGWSLIENPDGSFSAVQTGGD